MKTTILVSAAEKHEQQEPVATITTELSGPEVPTDGLDNARMLELLNMLAPLLKARRLQDFYRMELRYLVDGIPVLEQAWSPGENSHEPGRRIGLGLGECLWLLYWQRPAAPVLALD